MSPREHDVLNVFKAREAEGKPAPTHQDICNELGWTDRTTAREYIKALCRYGFIERDEGAGRNTSRPWRLATK